MSASSTQAYVDKLRRGKSWTDSVYSTLVKAACEDTLISTYLFHVILSVHFQQATAIETLKSPNITRGTRNWKNRISAIYAL